MVGDSLLRRIVWMTLMQFLSMGASGQNSTFSEAMFDNALSVDSVLPKAQEGANLKFKPVPKLAAKLAIVPGLGQLYNKDYWKLPLVYLSIGGGLYSFYLNNIKYRDYLAAYKSFYDMDKSSANYGGLLPGVTSDTERLVRVRNLFNTSSDSLYATRDRIARGKDYWRRNKNLSIIVSSLIYGLSIIEANVAAHLKTFDVSEDLTLQVAPKLGQPLIARPVPGVRLVLGIK